MDENYRSQIVTQNSIYLSTELTNLLLALDKFLLAMDHPKIGYQEIRRCKEATDKALTEFREARRLLLENEDDPVVQVLNNAVAWHQENKLRK